METKGKKILTVEDDPFASELLVKKLLQENFDVETAVNGRRAIEKLNGGLRPDLVILDLLLPDINGFEVLKSIRSTPAIASVPVIILTNLDQPEDVEKGQQLGIASYLVKANFTLEELVSHVKSALEKATNENSK